MGYHHYLNGARTDLKTVRYFSMFSGIGGFELGLERSGKVTDTQFECVGFSEIDKQAITTYEAHFDHYNFGDASKINPDDIGHFDLLVAGFPCQPFSIAGERKGFDDVRGTLFFDIVRILEHHKPKNFILENVKGLTSHDGGRTFRTIIQTLDELGYCVEWSILNSKDHGLAQNRERIYIVGHLGGIPESQVFSASRPSSPYTPIGLTTETTVARTLTAGGNTGGNHSGMTVLRTPQGDRRLTVTEWERLQGFPDGWTTGNQSPKYKKLGNAVSVNVTEHIGTRLYAHHTPVRVAA